MANVANCLPWHREQNGRLNALELAETRRQKQLKNADGAMYHAKALELQARFSRHSRLMFVPSQALARLRMPVRPLVGLTNLDCRFCWDQ